MCQHVIYLVERANSRYISQCEHGTVHLVWDAMGLHLPALAFVELATRIIQTALDLDTQGVAVETTRCRVQVGKLYLDLPAEEFVPLADMVDEALPDVNQREKQRIPPRLTFPKRPYAQILN